MTICTHEQKHYFGEISWEDMILSKIGELVQNLWMEIPNHVRENIEIKNDEGRDAINRV